VTFAVELPPVTLAVGIRCASVAVLLLALAMVGFAGARSAPSHSSVGTSRDTVLVGAPVHGSRACATPTDVAALRVVSLAPAASVTLDSLGLAGCVVGRARDDRSRGVARAPVVGSVLAPDAERIVAMRPNLVIAWAGADVRVLERRLGRDRLLQLPFERLEHAASGIRAVGRATGHVREAEALAGRLERRLARVGRTAARQAEGGGARPRVLWAVGYDPPFVAGPESLSDDLVTLAGGENVFADAPAAWLRPSVEQLVARAPDVLIWPRGSGLPPIEGIATASPWRRAVTRVPPDRIVELDAELVHEAGPRIAAAAELLFSLLHRGAEPSSFDSTPCPLAAEGPPACRSIVAPPHGDPSR
jgi:ABC-type Fe3+-hydroxamate transport system substrate-binding protein